MTGDDTAAPTRPINFELLTFKTIPILEDAVMARESVFSVFSLWRGEGACPKHPWPFE
jgi:hypothetical protein